MRKLFYALNYFLLLFSQQAFGIEVIGSSANLLTIKTLKNNTIIYAKNFQNNWVEFYKSTFVYKNGNGALAEQYNDILFVAFTCSKNHETCVRFFNRKTDALSKVYYNHVASNANQQIVAYYDRSKENLYLETMFMPCKKPMVYSFKSKLYPDSDFGQESSFLPDGDLSLNYTSLKDGKDVYKIIKVNYQEIINDCKNG